MVGEQAAQLDKRNRPLHDGRSDGVRRSRPDLTLVLLQEQRASDPASPLCSRPFSIRGAGCGFQRRLIKIDRVYNASWCIKERLLTDLLVHRRVRHNSRNRQLLTEAWITARRRLSGSPMPLVSSARYLRCQSSFEADATAYCGSGSGARIPPRPCDVRRPLTRAVSLRF